MVERKYMTRDICLHNFKFLPCSVCPRRASEKGRGKRPRGAAAAEAEIADESRGPRR